MLDDFPVILVKSSLKDGNILYANRHLDEFISPAENTDVDNTNLSRLFSKASLIFYETHIKPSLLEYGRLNEVQVTLLANSGERLPVVANLILNEQTIYWSMYVCVARDQIYQELIAVREMLEKKNEELAEIARIDPLTRLFNRRAALDDFNKIHNQIRRHYMPLTAILIDIDWFKKINDQHGHDVGDNVLCLLSNVLQKLVREADILARWGGEEFLIILFDTNKDDALKFTQRLMDEVRQIRFNVQQILTVSIGIAEITEDIANRPDCLDEVIKHADTALYEAKAQGRDRVIAWKA